MVISNWWGGGGEGELRSGEEFPGPEIETRSPALQSDSLPSELSGSPEEFLKMCNNRAHLFMIVVQ